VLAACSPAKREPVGVSNGGGLEHEQPDASVNAPPLPGLPGDFRSTWNKLGARIPSEHGRFAADVYEHDHARWAEDLFLADASAGIYLIDRSDGGVRYAIGDPQGRTIADGDAGALEACARCHTNARDVIFPIVP
jgi:hypothetical protein